MTNEPYQQENVHSSLSLLALPGLAELIGREAEIEMGLRLQARGSIYGFWQPGV